jgi:chitin synthase
VLPGAFSLLRWDAIKGVPVEKFLRGMEEHKLPLAKRNMFLAEDRIMCWQMIIQPIKTGESYGMIYVPGAKARTDPPPTYDKLIGQRRRWNNGSIAAVFYILCKVCKLWKTNHNIFQKLFLSLNLFFIFF